MTSPRVCYYKRHLEVGRGHLGSKTGGGESATANLGAYSDGSLPPFERSIPVLIVNGFDLNCLNNVLKCL